MGIALLMAESNPSHAALVADRPLRHRSRRDHLRRQLRGRAGERSDHEDPARLTAPASNARFRNLVGNLRARPAAASSTRKVGCLQQAAHSAVRTRRPPVCESRDGWTVRRKARAARSAESSGGSPSAGRPADRSLSSLRDELRRGASARVRRRRFQSGAFTRAATMSVSCPLEHGLGERSSGVSWVRSPSSVVRSHQHREAGGDDRAGSREDHPRAPFAAFHHRAPEARFDAGFDGARVPRA